MNVNPYLFSSNIRDINITDVAIYQIPSGRTGLERI
jgi:hypothetical protein